MAVAGSLTYDTNIDKTGFNQGLNSITNSVKSGGTKIKNIIAALGITKIISTAMNTIMNSIDGAVSRIDTLNNFPKVMSNLGIASEDSTKAINKLSDGLQGIPTKLDDAALSVQRFTSKNGDVDKSVDLFLAVNNALLAGGASAEIQSSAMEQLSQSYAKGKPDMVEWRAIQTAMPAQLKQISQEILGNKDSLDIFLKKAQEYADANPLSASGGELVEQLKQVKAGAGDMTTALGTALRLGIISMDDFMNIIVKLNKEGSGEFLSFEEQAKNATGGIQTSITNAKTAITRGVANIIDTIDKSLKKTELNGLGNIISKIGSVSEKALKKVANWISKIDFNKILDTAKKLSNVYGPKIKNIFSGVINIFKNMFSWASRNVNMIGNIVSIAISLIATMKIYKGVMTAIKAIDIAKNITSAINPAASLVAIAVGGIAVMATLTKTIANQKNVLQGVREEADLQQKSWQSLKETREASLANSESEIVTIQKLADELRNITDENGKVKEGYENRAKYILGELNNALGTEYTMNGNIINQYEELKSNIDELIAKKKAEATLEAYKEEYQTALKNQTEATKTLTDLRQKYNEELAKTPQNYQEEMEKSRNLAYIGEELRKQSELIGEYSYTIQNYENLTSASVSNNKEEINKALSEMGVSYDQAKAKVNTSLSEQIQSQSNYITLLKQSWQDAKNTNNTFQAEILQKQLETEQQSLMNLSNALAQQTSTVTELTEEQKIAWKNLADANYNAYAQGLANVPPEVRKKIQEATGIVIEDTTFSTEMGKKGTEAVMLFGQNLKIPETAQQKAEEASNNMSSNTTVKDGAEDLADSANRGFNDSVDGNKWGEDLSNNIASGITSKKSESWIVGAATSVGTWIKNIIGHSVPKAGPLKDELTYMPDMINNLVKGIEKNRYKVANATTKIAEDIKGSFNLEELNNNIINKMNRAVALETGSINATASVKSNNSMLNVINLTAKIDGSVDMNNQQVGRLVAPEVCKTIKAGGLA